MSDEPSAARRVCCGRGGSPVTSRVVVVAAIFVALGFWQLARNDEKQDGERAARAAYAAPAPALGDPDSPPPSGHARRSDGHVRRRRRSAPAQPSARGQGGYDVLTPLRLDDGTAVVVDRGWVARNAVDDRPRIARRRPPGP